VTRPLLALLCAVAALALAACGGREDPAPRAGAPERVELSLDYFPNADHAGLYAAIGTGAFEDVRLDVRPRTPSDPAAPLRLLEAGRVDLAISYEPEVLLARDRGAQVVAIGALVQEPLTSIISIGKDPVRRAQDLAGKRVGTAGIPYQDAYLKAILAEAGVDEGDVTKVDVGFNLTPAMLSGRVDATLGSFWNYEGVELERRRRNPTILRVERLGVPTYNELVIVARQRDARDRGAMLRRFMQGLARGHEALRRDPDSGIDPLLKANRDLDRGLQTAAVRATMPAFFPADGEQPFGWMDSDAWADYGRWMAEQDLLRRPEDPRRALTTEFLPGEGPQPSEP
jgi:putative hydroxymethylpyrimidine transport system substrate-binding protein